MSVIENLAILHWIFPLLFVINGVGVGLEIDRAACVLHVFEDNLLIAITIAVVIVLAMNLVGSLLISALVIFPALSAMRVYKNFHAVTICSAALSVCCAALGILISILAGTPVGSTIVAVDIAAFLVFSMMGRIKNGGVKK